MKTYHFTIPRTHVDVDFVIKKPFSFVLGGNATGKTTCSIAISNKANSFVFNDRFISKNVYVSLGNDNSGEISKSNKENLSSIFMGEDLAADAKILDKALQDKTTLRSLKNKANNDFNIYLKENNRKLNGKLEDFLSQFNSSSSYDKDKDLSDNLEKCIITPTNSQVFDSEEIFENEYLQFINNTLINDIYRQIKAIDVLRKCLFDGSSLEDEYQNDVISYNKNLQLIINNEKVFSDNSTSKFQEWIKDGLSFQDGHKVCVFCHAENRENEFARWKTAIENNASQIKARLHNRIVKQIGEIDSLLQKQKENLSHFLPKAYQSIIEIKATLESVKEKLEGSSIIDENLTKTYIIENVIKSESEIEYKLILHLLLKDFKKYLAPFFLDFSLKKVIDSQKKSLDEKMNKEAEIKTDAINKILESLGSTMRVTIVQDNGGGSRKFTLSSANGNIATSSEGELSELALAVFIYKIKNENLNNAVIVFDDPVDSLDVSKYYKFRKTIFDLQLTLPEKGNNQIVIFTHNFYFFMSLISCFLPGTSLYKKNILDVYSIGENGFKQIDKFEELLVDDINLLHRLLRSCKNSSEAYRILVLLPLITREGMDIRLKFSGITDPLNPKQSIQELYNKGIISENVKAELLTLNQDDGSDSKYIKNNILDLPSVSKSDFISKLQRVNRFYELLQLPKIITNEEITYIESTIDDNIKAEELNSTADFGFTIIDKANQLLLQSSKDATSHMRHPRYQLTESIINLTGSADILVTKNK